MRINRQDTNGVKPLLQVGELGYDNYPSGGDAGRVYVGNGSINIPQAKKSEVIAVDGKIDTHVVRVDNPHAVTKAQVGLSNVDNTSDSSKNVLSASKLTTARTITLTGDVTGSVSFDGTANANITATIASNSVALGIDTTGNYVADATAGNGIVITGTVGEGWNPTISLTDVGTVGTYKSVIVDAQGRVTAGTNPTTISGYGITDAYTKAELNAGQLDNRYYTETEIDTLYNTAVKLTGNQTIAGIKTFTSSPIVPVPTSNTQATNKAYVDGKYSGFKNYIINGKKAVNQRGLTSTDNSYNQDRWYKADNNWFQGIEGDNNLVSGKTYTLSWIGAATASYYIGTATSATINAQTFTSIANGGNFTLAISAGQNLWIKFASDSTGSTFNFVQLEEGSVASPFEHRPFGLELSLCQRYYQTHIMQFVGHGIIYERFSSLLPVSMRSAPTSIVTNGSGVVGYVLVDAISVPASISSSASNTVVTVINTLTPDSAFITAYITLSAEL